MRAWMIMLLAVIGYVIVRWSRNEPAVTISGVVGGAFAILVIALLDNSVTGEIASGLAWLFLIVVAYNLIPAVSNVIKQTGKPAKNTINSTVPGANLA